MFDKLAVFESQGWRCEHCGLSVYAWNHPQIAHRIPQRMAKRYGAEVIHHRFNVAGVCCLACNDALSISNHPVEILELVNQIKEDLYGRNEEGNA